MKNIILLLVAFIGCLTSAQTPPTEPLFHNTNYGDVQGTYYKDMDNNYNPYVGTWLYTNGNTSFKIVLQKKEMTLTSSGVGQYLKQYYADYLIGEYQYIENGVQKVNTLQNLSVNHSDMINYNLLSTGIVLKGVYPACDECSATERRIAMMFLEPSRRNTAGLSGGIMLRHYIENGVYKIKAVLYLFSPSFGVDMYGQPLASEELNNFSVPMGTYILIKQ